MCRPNGRHIIFNVVITRDWLTHDRILTAGYQTMALSMVTTG